LVPKTITKTFFQYKSSQEFLFVFSGFLELDLLQLEKTSHRITIKIPVGH
jgi:hypothetical protein